MGPSAVERAETPGTVPPVAARAVTPRAVVLGALLAAGSAFAAPYLTFRLGVSLPGSDSLMNTPILALLALVTLNGVLVRGWPSLAFSRRELLVIYAMLIVSLGWLTKGGLPFLVALITYPFYRATTANAWQSLVWPYIPTWLRVDNPDAVTWFWEGRPEYAAVPWSAWRDPALAWGAFTCALMIAMLCAASLLRRNWIERQRLAFPLVEIPLAIAGPAEQPSLGTTLMRSRLFLIGFSLPTAFGLTQWMHRFWPAVPALDLYLIPVGRAFSGMGIPWDTLSDMRLTIAWSVLGVMCLIPSDVALSLGLFYLLNKAQLVIWAAFGMSRGQMASAIDPNTFTAFEQAGGLIVLAGIVLYESRNSFRSAWRDLWRSSGDVPDSTSPLSGRVAVIGFFVANLFMLWFGLRLGMSWWTFTLLMGLFYMVILVGSKLIAAGGVLTYHTGLYALERSTMVGLLGTRAIGPNSLVVATYLSETYMDDPANLAMPQMMNALKLGHVERIKGKGFSWAMLIAIVVVVAVGLPAMLDMLYRYGAGSLAPWPFTVIGDTAFGDIDAALRDPTPSMSWRWLALGIGGVVMMAMSWMHVRFLWWPVSPIGFVIASGWSTENELWFCALIGWLLTTLIKRYGGLRLYRTLRPAFLGLVLGDVLTGSFTGILGVLLEWRRLMGQ